MTSRSRFIPLFILSAMITICPTTVLFGMAVFSTSSAATQGGLWNDLIRGTTEQTSGMRDVRILATIAGGIMAGVLMAITVGGLCSWLVTLLPGD